MTKQIPLQEKHEVVDSLRWLIHAKGINPTDFDKRIGVSSGMTDRWIKGVCTPGSPNIVKIVEAIEEFKKDEQAHPDQLRLFTDEEKASFLGLMERGVKALEVIAETAVSLKDAR